MVIRRASVVTTKKTRKKKMIVKFSISIWIIPESCNVRNKSGCERLFCFTREVDEEEEEASQRKRTAVLQPEFTDFPNVGSLTMQSSRTEMNGTNNGSVGSCDIKCKARWLS